ncbi:MAG: HU family DNA-binding protein [Bacteroidales bacterium]|nr:HU family DNA-binding protein [Bacteroidales bacterium]
MNSRFVLSELTDALVKAGHRRREAEDFVRAFFAKIEEYVFLGESVKITGLGTFKLTRIAARESVNVNTGDRIEIAEHYKLSFLPDSSLKEAVNAPYAQLEPIALDPDPDRSEEVSSKDVRQSLRETQARPDGRSAAASVAESAPKDFPVKNRDAVKKKEEPVFQVEEQKPEEKNDKKGTTIAWIIFVLLAMALIVYALCSTVFRSDSQPVRRPRPVVRHEVVTEVPSNPRNEVAGSAVLQTPPVAESASKPEATSKTDEVASKTEVTPTTGGGSKPDAVPTTGRADVSAEGMMDAAQWEVMKEITLGRGERLTLIAQEYYGDRVFWVYLYEANRDRISNPNKMAVGTRIRIPKAPASVVNPRDSASLRRAADLEDYYKKKFAAKK